MSGWLSVPLAGQAPWAVGAAIALCALALRAISAHRAAADRRRLADASVLDSVTPPPSQLAAPVRALLLAAGAGCLAAALAGTGGGGADAGSGPATHEIVLVLDASNSMLAEDVEPSRVGLQRSVARRFVTELDARFGIVYFAGGGYVLTPLTEDRDAALMFTESVDPSVVGRGGTSMPAGLAQGLAVLRGGQDGAPKALVLLSDGEATIRSDELEPVLADAAMRRIPIHAVGFGTADGARIPIPLGRAAEPSALELGPPQPPDVDAGGRRWLRGPDGVPVVSGLDEPTLRRIAEATGGLYVPAVETGIDALLDRLPRLGSAASPGSSALVLLLVAFGALFAEAYLFRRA